jgi:hypothetical protein
MGRSVDKGAVRRKEGRLMTFSISSRVPAASTGPTTLKANANEGASESVAPTPKTVRLSGDTVKLSQTAKIHALKQQGQGASQIAQSLGVSVGSVDSALGIVVKPAATVAPTGGGATADSAAVKATAAPQAIPIPANG